MRSLLFIFVGLLMAATLVSLTRGVRPAQSSISSDGRGYAAYLTNLAAQGNWDFDSVQAIENSKYSPDYAADFLLPYQGRMLNKYPPGVALAASPLY
ncbi:MAG TPA: hypothetical protein VFV37_08095, partial [Luteibaculaceae bacterium]|nr:hypothetical protein [Luteibaculaceae bacterium]